MADDIPALVRSTLASRDGVANEDHVAFYLDTFHDRRRSYVAMVNALGVQQDGLLVEGREPDFSFDFAFQSKGCLTATGYAVELSIPFESLRYEAGPERAWGLHVVRQVQRLGEENSWMPLRRDRTSVDGTSGREFRSRFLSQAGVVSGIDQPGQRPRTGSIRHEHHIQRHRRAGLGSKHQRHLQHSCGEHVFVRRGDRCPLEQPDQPGR